MTLRALLVSSPHPTPDASGWSGVGTRVRRHPRFTLIGEAFGEEAIGFASLSRPDLLIVDAATRSEAWIAGLRDSCPEARLIVVGPVEASDVIAYTALDATLDTLAAQLSHPASERPRTGNLLVVFSPKGGSGRSQLATNLAIALSRATSRETILFDAALSHGEQDLFLNLQPQGLASLSSPHRLDAHLASHPTGVKLLASSPTESDLSLDRVKQIVSWLQQRDAWIVADTHPLLSDLNRHLLREADRVLVPFNLDLSHLRALQRVLAALREESVDTSCFELVAWGERSEVSREDAARTLKRPVDWVLPFDPGKVRAAINQGIPLLQSEPRGPLARELSRLVATMGDSCQTTALVPIATPPWQGILNWLKRGPAPNGFGA